MLLKTLCYLAILPFILANLQNVPFGDEKIDSEENVLDITNALGLNEKADKILNFHADSFLKKLNSQINDMSNPQLLEKLNQTLRSGREEEQVAIINDWVEEVVTNINVFIMKNQMEPIDLEGFKETFKIGWFTGWVKFYEGTLDGLSSFRRQDDVKVIYSYPNLQTKVPLGFLTLNFRYKYEIKYMNLGPRGRAIGKSTGNKFTVDMGLNLITLKAQLFRFRLNTLGTLTIKLRGNVLTDWLVNAVIIAVKPVLRLIIAAVVESFVIDGINTAVNLYNTGVCIVLAHCV